MFALIWIFGVALAFELDSSSTIFVCNYTKPLTSIFIETSLAPCSSVYPNSLELAGFGSNMKVQAILDYKKLASIYGRRCFKLRLNTGCISHSFSANEIRTWYDVLSVTKSECLSSSTCLNCEIRDQYHQPQCDVWTLSETIKNKEVLFAYTINGYQDKILNYYFGSFVSSTGEFYLGGAYKEFAYLSGSNVYETELIDIIATPSMEKAISLEKKQLYTRTATGVSLGGSLWDIYDDQHYFLRSSASRRLLQSSQSYAELFVQAQINVTNWKILYLECRLKNIIIQSGRMSSADLDLGPGEIYRDGFINKYPCKRIVQGQIYNRNNCLSYQNNGDLYNITNMGELVNRSNCTKLIRVNQSHVLNVNSDNEVGLVEYKLLGLQDEEKILQYVPTFASNIQEIRDLIRSSSYYESSSPIQGPSFTSTAPRANSTWYSELWIYLLAVIVSCLIVAAIVFFVCYKLRLDKLLPNKTNEIPLTINLNN